MGTCQNGMDVTGHSHGEAAAVSMAGGMAVSPLDMIVTCSNKPGQHSGAVPPRLRFVACVFATLRFHHHVISAAPAAIFPIPAAFLLAPAAIPPALAAISAAPVPMSPAPTQIESNMRVCCLHVEHRIL